MKFRKICALFLCMVILLSASGCGHTHSFGNWTVEKEATCVKDGRKVRECKCGEKESKAIPMLKHHYISNVEAVASCQSEGITVYTCTDCDDSYTETSTVQTYSSTELYEMYLDSVGEVVTYDRAGDGLSLGTCFVYSEDGRIVTNYHVIENAYSAKVTFGEDTYDVKRVLAYDKDIDVAVLEIDATDLKCGTFCENPHSVGETVYAFGNSKGLTSTFSDGMITFFDRKVDGVNYIQHDAPISSGNSGGPLINSYGEIIGINTWTVQDSQNLNFAIHISELQNLDFGDPMSMKKFYDAECNAFVRLKSYLLENGTFDDEYNEYYLTLDQFYSEDYTETYSREAWYDVVDEEVVLALYLDDYGFFALYISEDSQAEYMWVLGTYETDYYIGGEVNAKRFTTTSNLTIDEDNVTDASFRQSLRELASTSLRNILYNLEDDFADLGLTAADLGFVYY